MCPWIACHDNWPMSAPKASQDQVGLSLSGGGIRSASFNLGLLQALDRLGLLSKISYISTVSGGGYTGGFYDVWRRCHPKGRLCVSGAGEKESPSVRHLREHSRFLVPRGGTSHVELWEGLFAVLLGLAVTVCLATAASVVLLVGWRVLVAVAQYSAFHPFEQLGDYVVRGGGAVLVLCTIYIFERRWHQRRFGDAGERGGDERPHVAWKMGLAAFALVLISESALAWWWPQTQLEWEPLPLLFPPLEDVDASVEFRPVIVLAICAALGGGVRILSPGKPRGNDPLGFGGWSQRLAARFVALVALAAALGFVWWISAKVPDWVTDRRDLSVAAAITATLSAAASLAFTTATKLFRRIKEVAIPKSVMEFLRPAIPIVLANVAVTAFLISVALVLRVLAEHPLRVWALGVIAAIPAVLMFVDATRFGVRELYRRRIYDAFLRAGTLDEPEGSPPDTAAGGRSAPEKCEPGSIEPDAVGHERWPKLLVCCAANDLGGDPLIALGRGASHAVFEGHTLRVTTRDRGRAGTHDRVALVDVSRSERLTASAAAVNSQMGSFSALLGPAVSFLTCALNLRLGLWVQLAERRRFWHRPGWFFFMEMLNGTRAHADWVHLSDGGHFENLALYELIRRECPYIIVSDCGADESIEFADLGNAIRRIREDFGVEIEIDVEPLRPRDGVSKQHVVAGTIHYDGFEGLRKGILLYVKPTMTGDEPPDIQHYRSRNPAFPHESTGDQFFDEAQWESYRRLGEHVGRRALGLVEDLEDNQLQGVERIFTDARRRWHVAPPGHAAAFSGLRERSAELEKELRAQMPDYVRAEFLPEVYAAHRTTSAGAPAADETTKVVVFYIAVAQLMEDAWVACRFETHGEHPLNEGWLGYMRRWASMSSFRQWWPIIRPLFSAGFRDFMKRRFELSSRVGKVPGRSTLHRKPFKPGAGGDCYAWQQLAQRRGYDLSTLPDGYESLAFYLALEGGTLEEIQVGILLYRTRGGRADWSHDDWHVPSSLHGAGFVGKFLDEILEHGRGAGWNRARVNLGRPVDRLGRQRAVRAIEFFRGRGFSVQHEGEHAVCERKLRQPD